MAGFFRKLLGLDTGEADQSATDIHTPPRSPEQIRKDLEKAGKVDQPVHALPKGGKRKKPGKP